MGHLPVLRGIIRYPFQRIATAKAGLARLLFLSKRAMISASLKVEKGINSLAVVTQGEHSWDRPKRPQISRAASHDHLQTTGLGHPASISRRGFPTNLALLYSVRFNFLILNELSSFRSKQNQLFAAQSFVFRDSANEGLHARILPVCHLKARTLSLGGK